MGIQGSWHDDYKGVVCSIVRFRRFLTIVDSAYIYVGGLNSELTEGDVITIFSQYVGSPVVPWVVLIDILGTVR